MDPELLESLLWLPQREPLIVETPHVIYCSSKIQKAHMSQTYRALRPGVRYEKIVRSSQDFDHEVQRLMNFWFNGMNLEC